MYSTILLEQKGCSVFHFSTNNWKLVYHVNKYKAIQNSHHATKLFPFFSWVCSTGPFGDMKSNHRQAALSSLGLVEHLMSTPLPWCTWHLPSDGCSYLASTVFADGCAGWGLWSQDQLAEWITEATLAQGPEGFGWQRLWGVSSAVGQLGQKKPVVSAFTDQTRVINNYYKGFNWGLHVPVTW